MAEQNNQAERAAPELPACPFCGGKCDPAGWYSGDGKRGPECEDCGATANSIEDWCRRAALPAAVDAEGLPPLPAPAHRGPEGTGSYFDSYTAEQYRQGQREAKALGYALGRGAAVRDYINGGQEAIAADRRKQAMTQPAPAAGTVKDAERWRETLLHVGGTYTDVGVQRFTLRYLNPVEGVDIMKGSVTGHFTAAIDAAIEAHNRAGK